MPLRITVDSLDPNVSEGARLLWKAARRAGSQTALSREVGVNLACLWRWLRGKQKPNGAFRSKLLRLYGIPFDAWETPPRKPFSLSAHAA